MNGLQAWGGRMVFVRMLWSLLWAVSASAQATSIRSFSPQGEVSGVRQVVVQFDEAVVNFGDARGVDAMQLSCNGATPAGAGRWSSEREWLFDFDDALPDGVVCAAQPHPDFQPLSGSLTGTTQYGFQTGGPRVLNIWPRRYEDIDEEQYFVLHLSAPVALASLREHMWCVSDSVGERIGVRLVDASERELLVANKVGKAAAQQPQQYPVVACNRRLTASHKMQLVFGAGVTTTTAVAGKEDRVFDYRVRDPFVAVFTCERENSHAACLPNRPMQLRFSAPVPVALLEQVYLQKNAAEKVTAAKHGGAAPANDDPAMRIAPVWDETERQSEALGHLMFAATGEESQRYTLVLPADMRDDMGRPLINAAQFPLQIGTAEMPPLVKFSAAPFGIVERYAEGDDGPALLPVTVRSVEPELRVGVLNPVLQPAAARDVQTLKINRDVDIDDAALITWLARVQRYHGRTVPRWLAERDGVAGIPPPRPVKRVESNQDEDDDDDEDDYDPDYERIPTRVLSLLAEQPAVQTLTLPPTEASRQPKRPFEVIGIPLESGFHVVEIASPMLGQALLAERDGAARQMVVRTAVLVTNLAVHFKLGQENALAWVTRLDDGSVVPGARVQVSNCQGVVLARATTDANGVASFDGLPPHPGSCRNAAGYGNDDSYFVSARAPDPKAGKNAPEDLAFVWSNWNDGIEPWRFNVSYRSRWSDDDGIVAHTVFDRSLIRAGETISMKHVIRQAVGVAQHGLTLPPPARWPNAVIMTHTGSGLKYTQPLTWRRTASGGLSAESQFAIPEAARLGEYTVDLVVRYPNQAGRSDDYRARYTSGRFRVEEFRLPVLEGHIAPLGPTPLIATTELPVQVSINYLSGGAAAQLPVQVSAISEPYQPAYPDWPGFRFERQSTDNDGGDAQPIGTTVLANKLALTLDAHGQATATITSLPRSQRPRRLLLEASYADPSGEVQTLASSHTWWPAAVVAGIKAERWMGLDKQLSFQALALDVQGRAQAGVPLQVVAIARRTTSSRKRLVGGFYSYDSQTQEESLGLVCEGVSDAQGLLACDMKLDRPGEIELLVTATDANQRHAVASAEIWVSRNGDWWFAQDDHDRMDVLPEKPEYQPGETARFQVRMPYREATALVSIEREGISQTQVVRLTGANPTLELKVQPDWGPNVFVSVLALRGRVRQAPWYSQLFTWERGQTDDGRQSDNAPTTLVDLAKPSFRLGVAQIRVGTAAHRIKVAVEPEHATYQVRDTARVTIRATLPDGQPAAHAEVAVAAVDQALLDLMPNRSWSWRPC